MTMRQWCTVLEHCIKQPEYIKMKKTKRFVTMYDITELFVKPWSMSTGCGLAILMSKELEQSARLMVSHGMPLACDSLCLHHVFPVAPILAGAYAWGAWGMGPRRGAS